jgi:hypothetical protein
LRARAAEVAAISALAAIVTVAMAAPVLRAPSDRVFGMEIVGRHHDPFTVMEQFGRPIAFGVYSQPITDIMGALLARISGPVAAYNWLVLLSFPLSAAAAYLLARHLALPAAGAAVAAMAYAFSPFHVAQAAYHPHIAQTQWLPLYLLALWRCLDLASPRAVGFLVAAALAVTLSNFYGGLIAAVITPIAAGAYWLASARKNTRSTRHLAITAGTLLLLAGCGVAYASAVVSSREVFAFPRADLFRYSAKWWGYLVPPVAHPLLGERALRVWNAVDIREGLLEQQVSLGWGIVALGAVAVFWWVTPRKLTSRSASVGQVPVLVGVAAVALLCSLSPERTIGTFTFVRPSALLYDVVPMFRSYARFGVVVQLMAALLAGIGLDCLRRTGSRRARFLGLALVGLAAAEYAASPGMLWRDVLPTTAHRWAMQQADPVRVLDCTPLSQESRSIQWLTRSRVTVLGGSIPDCAEPNLPQKLAASGYTHVLVRHGSSDGQWFGGRPPEDGLRDAAQFDDGRVFAVVAPRPAVYTATTTGFFPRERNAAWTWQWMGTGASWTIVNTTAHSVMAALDVEVSAFHRSRRLEVRLDGRPVTIFTVDPPRRTYSIGPLDVGPGAHDLVFRPLDPPTVAKDVEGGNDPRPLSFAVGSWSWTVRSDRP